MELKKMRQSYKTKCETNTDSWVTLSWLCTWHLPQVNWVSV